MNDDSELNVRCQELVRKVDLIFTRAEGLAPSNAADTGARHRMAVNRNVMTVADETKEENKSFPRHDDPMQHARANR